MRLNLDAAELDEEPAALTALADLLNIACGAHAGSAQLDRVGMRLRGAMPRVSSGHGASVRFARA